MENIMNQKPCNTCNADRQIENPDRWQCECDRCTKIGQWRNEAIKRLSEIEHILGNDYDLDRLRELVEADREGRIKAEPRARRCPKCGKHKVFPRIDWKYFYCYSCNTQFSANEYTKALKGEQGG